MTKTYELVFDGYWRDVNKASVPSKSGIYVVYSATYNLKTAGVVLHRVLYIGESDDVRGRIDGHERRSDWERLLKKGETLCYSFASISKSDGRERAECATIYIHKPPLNDDCKNSFSHPETTISTSGKNAHLKSQATATPPSTT